MDQESTTPATDAPAPSPEPVAAPASTPSFRVDVEAFKAAAPEGYDVHSAENIISINKGDIFNIVKQNAELQKSFSSRMPVPDPSNPEKMAEIYGKLGRPESPDGYDFGDSVSFKDDDSKSYIAEQMHKLGLSNDQATKLLELQVQMNQKSDSEYEQMLQNGKALTEKQVQEWSGAIKGSRAYNDWNNVADSTLKHFGVDRSDPNVDAFFASDSGRAVLKLAYDYGTAAQPGKILGIAPQTETVSSLTQRRGELMREMVKLGDSWNAHPEKQRELDSIKQQIRQMQR